MRAYTKQAIQSEFKLLNRSKIFQPLPSTLSKYEQWTPTFNLLTDSHPNAPVKVVFRLKESACPTDMEQCKKNQSNLFHTWMSTILIPAVDSLPCDSRTRLNNTSHTYLSSGMLPTYVKIYGEDVDELDSAFRHQTALAPFNEELC